MAKIDPPTAPAVDEGGDEFGRSPVYGTTNTAPTGPREVAAFLGPPSKVITPKSSGA